MKIFITGASGFIGSKLAARLADTNFVRILLRDPSKAIEFSNTGIEIIYGDILNKEALKKGMENCDLVFHLAAFTRPASKDAALPFTINVTGTLNVLEVAKEMSVKKVIITSTAGTMGFSHDGFPVDEQSNISINYHTEYERTKAYMEKKALEFNSDDIEIIIINPARVYGPGKLNLSNSVTRIIKMYGEGLWRIIPGDGKAIGNYVFIDDVVNGHILAALKGMGGERYILGGENLSYNEFFDVLGDLFNRKRVLFRINDSLMKGIVKTAGLYSGLFNRPKTITEDWMNKYLQNWIVSSNKAIRDLNYEITPFREGAAKTISWLDSMKT